MFCDGYRFGIDGLGDHVFKPFKLLSVYYQLICVISYHSYPGRGGGGGLRYTMATHNGYTMATAQSGSSEHQHIGLVSPFEGKKGGWSTSK